MVWSAPCHKQYQIYTYSVFLMQSCFCVPGIQSIRIVVLHILRGVASTCCITHPGHNVHCTCYRVHCSDYAMNFTINKDLPVELPALWQTLFVYLSYKCGAGSWWVGRKHESFLNTAANSVMLSQCRRLCCRSHLRQPHLPNHEQQQLQPYPAADTHHSSSVLAPELLPLPGSTASGLHSHHSRSVHA